MKIKIRLFGAFRKYSDTGELELEIPENSTVNELCGELRSLIPDEGLISESAIADESRILEKTEKIKEGSTLAILPPVCGG